MPSKLVTDRGKSGTLVLASIGDNKPRLMEKLSIWPGIPPEATAAVLEAVATKLETADGAMVAADRANLAEQDDDAPFRLQRDEARQELADGLGTFRDTMAFVYGDSAPKQLGLDVPMPVDPAAVHSLAGDVLGRLAGWTPPANAAVVGFTFDKATWTAKLSTPAEKLGSALASLAKEKREAEFSQVEKNRAIAEHDRAFGFAANLLSTMLEAVGDHELARRVRPSRKRPGQTAGEVAEATTTTEAPVSEP